MQKDQNTSLPTLMDQLGSAVTTTDTGTGQLNAATSNLLQQALVNLTDSRFNGNEAVRNNARDTAASVERLKSGADDTPFAHSIVLQDASQANVTLPVWGRTYTLSVTGGNLAGASLKTSAMVCNVPTVSPTNTLMVAICTIDTAGGQASVAVRVNGKVVHGKAPSASYYLGDGKASCQSGAAVVGSVTPTSLVYATQDQLITVRGCDLGVDALATLDGVAASPQAGATATQLQYRFDVSNRRLTENRGSLQIGAAPQTVQVFYQCAAGGLGFSHTVKLPPRCQGLCQYAGRWQWPIQRYGCTAEWNAVRRRGRQRNGDPVARCGLLYCQLWAPTTPRPRSRSTALHCPAVSL